MATLPARDPAEETPVESPASVAENGRGIEERVAKVQAMIKAELGELPKGRVDAFLAERKAAAERGE